MQLRLKNYLPRSLFWRAALILLLPVVATQLVVSVIFIQRHFDGVTRQLTQGVMLEMRLLVAEIAAAPDGDTAAAQVAPLAAGLAIAVDMTGRTPPPRADVRAFWDLSGRSVLATLRSGMPGLIAADLQTDRRRVAIWLDSDKGVVSLTLSRSRLSATNPHQLLVVMVLASVLLTLIASVFLRNQLTPITRLARAAEAFGRGETLPYRPRGATEVRAAGTAFLDMRARIERQIEQRTLMLSGVSHDLRAPLTRLKLGLAILPEDAERRALMSDVGDMERLVDEFLAFVRGDALEETVAVDPADLVVKSVENAQRLGLALQFGRLESVGTVRLRPDAVMRAVDNLIGNAARFGTRAEVSLLAFERSFRIVVEDDGPGIPKHRRDEALLPFTRLDPARDPNRGGGVGLGGGGDGGGERCPQVFPSVWHAENRRRTAAQLL